MKILFLCNKSPWPAKEGGPMAMSMLIDGLIEAGHKVKVLAVNSFKYNIDLTKIPADYLSRTRIELIDIDLRVKIIPSFLNLFTGRSYHVQRFISGNFREKLIRCLQAETFDIVQLETLFMGPYIPDIRKYSRAKIILRAHNIEHLIWERIAGECKNPVKKLYLRHLSSTLKKYEYGILPQLNGIAAITPTDAGFFRNILQSYSSSGIQVTDIPFGVHPEKYESDNGPTEFPSLFTLGSMNWIPNQEGVKWFLLNVWPDIHKQFPKLKYYLAGREMPEWMKRLDLPNIVIAGEVEDAIRFIHSKAIMLVPLFSGSGIRIKIIEAMAAGKTVITTSLGAEGIAYSNHQDLLIANLPCEFFEMISVCVSNQQACEKIGIQAKKLIETKYNSNRIIEKLTGFYQQSRD